MRTRVLEVKNSPHRWGEPLINCKGRTLERLEQALLDLVDADIEGIEVTTLQSLRLWSDRLRYFLHYLRQEMVSYAPWLLRLQSPPPVILEAGLQSPLATNGRHYIPLFHWRSGSKIYLLLRARVWIDYLICRLP
jgi:hypothetical protein